MELNLRGGLLLKKLEFEPSLINQSGLEIPYDVCVTVSNIIS